MIDRKCPSALKSSRNREFLSLCSVLNSGLSFEMPLARSFSSFLDLSQKSVCCLLSSHLRLCHLNFLQSLSRSPLDLQRQGRHPIRRPNQNVRMCCSFYVDEDTHIFLVGGALHRMKSACKCDLSIFRKGSTHCLHLERSTVGLTLKV